MVISATLFYSASITMPSLIIREVFIPSHPLNISDPRHMVLLLLFSPHHSSELQTWVFNLLTILFACFHLHSKTNLWYWACCFFSPIFTSLPMFSTWLIDNTTYKIYKPDLKDRLDSSLSSCLLVHLLYVSSHFWTSLIYAFLTSSIPFSSVTILT